MRCSTASRRLGCRLPRPWSCSPAGCWCRSRSARGGPQRATPELLRRDVVVEAEAVVRVELPLHRAEPREALRAVLRLQAVAEGLACVVDVAAADRPRRQQG